mmetsp:Transcript_2446/g.3560  ORF Transcript_2446/g.3560 Transcript_2446/m.3560 type:complete len:379 (+) Transcript_2446:114-1250(+)
METTENDPLDREDASTPTNDDEDTETATIHLLGSEEEPIKKQKNRKKMLVFSFTQHKSWSFNPRWKAGFIGGCLFFFAFPLFILGLLLIILTKRQKFHRVSYSTACNFVRGSNCSSSQTIVFPEALHPPIYVYYELEPFYQNYRAYIKSVSDLQLAGHVVSLDSAKGSCPKMYESVNPDVPLFPCGLRSYSMFNDTIQMSQNGTVLCSSTGSTTACVAEITSDARRVLFKQPDKTSPLFPSTLHYPDEPMHALPNVTSDRYMQWMKTNIGPNMRKLYRRIDVPLNGTMTLDVTQHFYSLGSKSILFTEYTPFFGGYNLFVSIIYFCVSGVFVIFGCILCLGVLLRHVRLRKKAVVTTELSITPRGGSTTNSPRPLLSP